MVSMAILFGIVAMLGWGFWAVFAKLATNTLPPALAMVISYVTASLIAFGYVYTQRASLTLPMDGVLLAAVAGLFAGIGGVVFYMGLDIGRASIVTTLGALYFAVPVVVGILFLGEVMDAADAAGIGFAIVAVLLLAR